MSYGISILKNNGEVLIDQDYSNHVVYSGGFTNAGETTIAMPGIPGQLVIVNISYSSSLNRVHKLYGPFNAPSQGLTSSTIYTNVSVPYKILVPSSSMPAPTGYHLNIYKQDGGLAFSTAYEYPKFSAHYAHLTPSSGLFPVIPAESPRWLSVESLYPYGQEILIHLEAPLGFPIFCYYGGLFNGGTQAIFQVDFIPNYSGPSNFVYRYHTLFHL